MNENNYFKILKIFNSNNEFSFIIKNLLNKPITIIFNINETEYNMDSDSVIETKFINSNEIFISIGNEDITFKYDMTPYSKLQVGFGPDTLIETKNKAINISEINSGDIIIDSAGNNVVVKNVIVTVVDKLFKVILIKKSKCGLNLPYSNIVMSIKNNLKIKKIILKGRNLFLNGKADVYKLSDNFPLYSIEIEGKKDYLLNGFIVESV